MTSADLLRETNTTDAYSGASPLRREHAAELLRRIVQQCRERIVVFDLDSTLLNNRPRSALIMREFAQQHQIDALANARADHWQDWSAATAMANMGVDNDTIHQHIDSFESFWHERFFTSDYCAHDEAIDGAVEFVRQVQQAGAHITYLTGRPTTMRDGTIRCFERLGLPLPLHATNQPDNSGLAADGNTATVTLIMKPLFDGSDDEFKQQQATLLAAQTSTPARVPVAAVFDNEPQHINIYHTLMTDTDCIHLFTDHSMRRIPLQAGIPSIRDFAM
jgi:hypothetical protein